MTEPNNVFISNSLSSIPCSSYWDLRGAADSLTQDLDTAVSLALEQWKFHQQQQEKMNSSIEDKTGYIGMPVDVIEPFSNGFQSQLPTEMLKDEFQRLKGLKEDFLSTVSHELKTPLSSMYLSIQLLELLLLETGEGIDETDRSQCIESVKSLQEVPCQTEQSQDSSHNSCTCNRDNKRSQIKQCLTTLSKECRKEITLINNLLDLQGSIATLPSPAPTCIFLHDWLDDLLKPFYGQFKHKRHQFFYDVAPTLSYIISDRVRLEKIVQELMTNACKFTPDEGLISLSVKEQENAVVLTVLSKGDAIPLQDIPHLFDMFYRVPNSDPWKTGGTGIGLALVKKLTEAIGGNIRVSTGSFGNAFTLCLPRAKEMTQVGA